jgi:hypothetical protein
MRCAACRQQQATLELLCDDCVDELACPFRLAPDRVRTIGLSPAVTVLVDPWGRPHPLDSTTLVGRNLDGAGIMVMETSVSRHHAHIARDPARGWIVRDLGSTNGTFVGEERVESTLPVRPGDRVRFADVGFYFLELPVLVAGPSSPRPSLRRTRSVADTMPERAAPASGDLDDAAFEEGFVSTRIGLPSIAIKLLQPSGGGGGLIEVDGKHAQLTLTQFELLGLLCRRSIDEVGAPDATRGFVGSPELVQRLSWDTQSPNDDHLKQLVHRLRRLLDKAGIGDLIESRQGFGYRLRILPAALTGPTP